MRTILFLATWSLSTCLFAGTTIDESRSIAPDGSVVVKNVKGEIVVTGADTDQMQLTGELGDGSRELSIRGGPSRWYVEVDIPRNSRRVEESVLYLRVPRSVDLDLEGVSARIDVENVENRRISVASVSGDVTIGARTNVLEIEVVSGDLEIDGSFADARFNTVSGDIVVNGLKGDLDMSSVSGEVLLRGAVLRNARLESVSGDMEIEAAMAPGADVSIETLSGDIELHMEGELSASVEVESYSGSIRSDRGEVKKAKFGPNQSLAFRIGEGDARIRIESFSGTVDLRTDRK